MENAQQMSLFGEDEDIAIWKDYARTISFSQHDILVWIMRLHNDGRPFEVDASYSQGKFYNDPRIPEPRYKFDIDPQMDGVIKADSRQLPIMETGSIGSIVFDPPFVMKDTEDREPNGKIEMRFSGLKNSTTLLAMYAESLVEFHSLLYPGGIVVFKCQDTVSSSKQHWIHYEVMKMAQEIGFYIKDLFILCRNNVMWSPNMKNQKHARRHHSYFLVLERK